MNNNSMTYYTVNVQRQRDDLCPQIDQNVTLSLNSCTCSSSFILASVSNINASRSFSTSCKERKPVPSFIIQYLHLLVGWFVDPFHLQAWPTLLIWNIKIIAHAMDVAKKFSLSLSFIFCFDWWSHFCFWKYKKDKSGNQYIIASHDTLSQSHDIQ